MKKLCFVLAVVMVLCAFLSACSPAEQPAETTKAPVDTDAGAAVPVTPAEDTSEVRIGVTSDINTLDIQNATTMLEGTISINIYDSLLFFDTNGNPNPSLAEEYSISDDGTVYTFKLRKGVLFHNGEELKASDVKFTIERGATCPVTAGTCRSITAVEVVDDYTVKVTIASPSASFLYLLCSENFPIYNEKAVTDAGDAYGANPSGTSSYKFVSRQAGAKISLERFDESWHGKAPVKFITYHILPDAYTAGVALETGDIDLLWGVAPAVAETLAENENVTLTELPTLSVAFIALNCEVAPLDNKLVRQAIAYAVNREDMIAMNYNGMANVADAIPMSALAAYSAPSVTYPRDVEKAKALLAEAGYPNGFKLDSPFLVYPALSGLAQILQQNLADIGITATIETQEFNTCITTLYSGNYQVCPSMYTLTVKDMDAVGRFYKSDYIGGPNCARYNNPKVDELFNTANVTIDPAKRTELYKQILDIVQEDVPYVPIANPYSLIATSSKLNIKQVYSVGVYASDLSW